MGKFPQNYSINVLGELKVQEIYSNVQFQECRMLSGLLQLLWCHRFCALELSCFDWTANSLVLEPLTARES